MKKLIAVFCLVFAAMLAGCAATAETSAESHTKAVQATQEIITLFGTPTLRIELVGGLIVANDRTAEPIYYMNP